MSSKTVAELEIIFRQYFDEDDLVLRSDMTADDVEDWDSLAQVGLILSIERKYAISFESAEIAKLENVAEMAALIDSKR
jgi:acyl carrier protein